MTQALRKGRRALARCEWKSAFDQLCKADHESGLDARDLERLGYTAYLIGKDEEAVAAWTRAHNAFVERDERLRAARVGFWLSLCLMLGGNAAQSGGWLSRTQRLIEGREGKCAEHGLALVVSGLFSLFKGDAAAACTMFEQASSLGERFADQDLLAVGVLSKGQALIQMQRIDEGVALLDEAMVSVTASQVTPIMAGIIYCAVILACEGICDLQRAREWTDALDSWCREQPELVAFRGQCLVHRAEVLRFKGDWMGAMAQAARAIDMLPASAQRSIGRAIYQQAELHRLTGDLARAEQAYRQAGLKGFEPQPGLSLLRLAQGDAQAAASIRHVASDGGRPPGSAPGIQRTRLLAAFVDIMLALDDPEPARAAVEEMERVAARWDSPFLSATAHHARGALLLRDDRADAALASLHQAWTLWQRLEAPFESACARVLIGRACGKLGDEVGATMHHEAAVAVFERLGAATEIARLRTGAATVRGPGATLSCRERQVLALLAPGRTNREIAAELGISEHTVARHLSNIFNKIGVSTRTAASAFAIENDLV